VSDSLDTCVLIRDGEVSLVLDLSEGRLPAIPHWGRDLGDLSEPHALSLIESGAPAIAANIVDEPVRMSLLPEHWTGWVGRPGLSGERGGRNWSPQFTTTTLAIDGQIVDAASAPKLITAEGPTVVRIEAMDEAAALSLVVEVELLSGGLIRTRAQVTNLGEPYRLHDLVLALPVPAIGREILDLAGRWGKERIPQRRPLTVGMHLREGRKGRTGPDAATVLHVGTPGFNFRTGEIWAVHTGWSGNHTHYAERLSTGEQVIGGGELLLPGEVVLGHGQSYTSPWLYASYGTGLDEVARRFHRYLRSRERHPSSDRPVTLNVWEAVYFNHDLNRLAELAEIAAELGVERFVLDDGWFGARRDDRAGLGDWVVSSDVWPEGLHPLIDKVTGLGMQFGLWFEPEMINLDSDVARAHPEWVMATGGRMPVSSRSQQVINLGIPECYAFIRDAILALLDEYKISYIKWDHNRDLIDAGTQPDGRPGVHEQTLAFYRLLDEINEAHPEVEIESCAGGGGRVDLGVLARTERVWASDCIDPLERQQIARWTAQLIPPELIGAHIASARSHTTGRVHDLDFRGATAVFGHLGVEWDLTKTTEDEREQLGAWIELFKRHRHLLLDGDLVRIDYPDDTLTAGGVVAFDQSEAIYSFASVGRSEAVFLGRIRLPGLDPKRAYRVTPMMVDYLPSGLRTPPWWGFHRTVADEQAELTAGEPRHRIFDRGSLGMELPGSVLVDVGLMPPPVNPDHAVLYHVTEAST
jgi:alpha-galactosidase